MTKVTVCAIIKKDGKILLTKRAVEPYRRYWCLPGGHVEYGETVENAVKREVYEEVGIKVKPKFLGYFDEIIKRLKWHRVVMVFSSKTRKEPKISKEVLEAKWFSKGEIKKMRLAFRHKEILKKFGEL